jgi:hypothetical protein
MHHTADADPTWLSQGLQSRRDVDPIAEDVFSLDDHVAEIDAYAQFDATVRPDASVPVGHRPLHLDRAAHRINDTREFHQHAITGGLDDAAAVLGDLRIEQLMAQRFEAFERAFLVRYYSRYLHLLPNRYKLWHKSTYLLTYPAECANPAGCPQRQPGSIL